MVVDVVFLAGHPLAVGQNAFGAAQLHIHALGLHALNDSGEDLVFLLGILVVDLALLRLADALHDDLLGRLRRSAQEARGRHVDFGDVAHAVIGADLERVLQGDLVGGVLHLVSDGLAGEHLGHAGGAVQGDA